MWFFFGLISLVSFTIWFVHVRLVAAWKGKTGTTQDGRDYQYKEYRYKGRLMAILVGIDGPQGYGFSLKWEKRVDRFFKAIGLSREFEIGLKDFDDLVYIVSDDVGFREQLESNTAIVDAVASIFGLGSTYQCDAVEISCRAGRLWVRLVPRRGFIESDLDGVAAEVVPNLESLSAALQTPPRVTSSKWREPFAIRAAIILSISSGLAFNGMLSLWRLPFSEVPFTVDIDELLETAIYCGVGIFSVLIVASLYFLGSSARTHLVVIELVFVGLFGGIATSFMELRDLNMEMDRSPATELNVHVSGKDVTRGRRGSSYYVFVDDWNGRDSLVKVRISGAMYSSISRGDVLVIRQRLGYLHFRWVEEVRKGNGYTPRSIPRF